MYTENEVGQLIEDLVEACRKSEEIVCRLVWVGKGNIPNYPFPNISLHLRFADKSLTAFEIMPSLEIFIPETAANITFEGKDFFRKIRHSDLEIVIKAFIAKFGQEMSLHTGYY